jgi:predicted component of type VI protein secretion system
MKPIRSSILADLEKAAPIAQAAPGAVMPSTTELTHGAESTGEAQGATAAIAMSPTPQSSPANVTTAPKTVAPSAQWRTLPKKVQTTQFNVRIRSDLYETLKELGTYSPHDSMTSIAARGIEKEIALMLFERGEALK